MKLSAVITNLIMFTLRVGAGVVIVNAGMQLLRGDALLSSTEFDSVLTGIFVVLLGLYCVAFGLYNNVYRALRNGTSPGRGSKTPRDD